MENIYFWIRTSTSRNSYSSCRTATIMEIGFVVVTASNVFSGSVLSFVQARTDSQQVTRNRKVANWYYCMLGGNQGRSRRFSKASWTKPSELHSQASIHYNISCFFSSGPHFRIRPDLPNRRFFIAIIRNGFRRRFFYYFVCREKWRDVWYRKQSWLKSWSGIFCFI